MKEWDEVAIETGIMKEIVSGLIEIMVERYFKKKFLENYKCGVSISDLYAVNREGRMQVRMEVDLSAKKKDVERLSQKLGFAPFKTKIMLELGGIGLAKNYIIPKRIKSFLKADLNLKIEKLSHFYENENLHIYLKADASMAASEFEKILKRYSFA